MGGKVSVGGDKAFLRNVYADDYMNTAPTGSLTKARVIENAAAAAADRRKANPQTTLGALHPLRASRTY